jgi:hypothetical protein
MTGTILAHDADRCAAQRGALIPGASAGTTAGKRAARYGDEATAVGRPDALSDVAPNLASAHHGMPIRRFQDR